MKAAMKQVLTQISALIGDGLAAINGDILPVQNIARETNDVETLSLLARTSALNGFHFLEISTLFCERGIKYAGVREWSEWYEGNMGQEWNAAERRRFAFLVAEYLRALEEAGGEDIAAVSTIDLGNTEILFDLNDLTDDLAPEGEGSAAETTS